MTVKRIIFCGDTFLRTRDVGDPLAEIRPTFQNASVCLNLETALSGVCQKEKNVTLSIDEVGLDWLTGEIQILTIVNNHVNDSDDPKRLAHALIERGKTVIGSENPSVTNVKVNGLNVTFLAAYFALPRLRMSYNGDLADTLERMLRNSKAERKILNLHWGYEHTSIPSPFQKNLARRLIDAGADLIIGHHPHVPQGLEVYNGKTIFYSLGNFNFWQLDGKTSENNRWGYMVDYDLLSGNVTPVPYRINDNYQPFPVSHEEKAALLLQLQQLNEALLNIDDQKWFMTQYDSWYCREVKVWKRRCLARLSPTLWVKWIIWLCLPMQLRYYCYSVQTFFLNKFQEN